MDFLSPWYLLGAAAIIAPILLHLRRRPPKDFVPFSTLMFLDKTPERLTRRSKLERWWLLLLRCAVMILLALLFARPFFNSDKAGFGGGEGRRVVVLLDRSGSMQRDGMWKKALAQADGILKQASASDEIAFATFDDELNVLSGFDVSREASTAAQIKVLRAQLDELKVGWGGSGLGNALIAAADLIETASAESGERQAKEIVVISDFQEGVERDSLNRFAWPESIRVHCVPVEPEKAANLTLNLVATLREGEEEASEGDDVGTDTTASGAQQRVRIRNARAGGREATFALRWDGASAPSNDEQEGSEATAEATVVRGQIPPGGSRVVSAPPRADEAADGVLVLEADGDDHDFDNRAYVARIQPRPVRVLYVSQQPDAEDPATALFYLLRAMQPTSVLTPQVESIAFADLAAEDVADADLIVVATSPSPAAAEQLGKALDSGAAVFWICRDPEQEGDASAAAIALDTVTGLDGWSITEAPRRGVGKDEYAMLANLDFESPVLAAFARAKVRDFTGIHIWKHRLVELPKATGEKAVQPRVLASYDGGAPAWLEVRRGAGRLYLFTSGWEPAESQLALSSKFVPLLYAMLGEAGFSALVPEPLVVGEPLPAPLGIAAATVKLPDGSSVESDVNEGVFLRTEMPGLYSVSDGASERVYAVNLAPDESRVDTFDPLLLADFSMPVLVDATEIASDVAGGRRAAEAREEAALEQRRLERSEKEKRQKLWKWLVLAVLGVLLLESWVAGRVPGTDESGSEPSGQPV